MIVRAMLFLLLSTGAAVAAPLTVRVAAVDDSGKEVAVRGARVLVGPAEEVMWPERTLPESPLVTDEKGLVTVDRPAGAVLVAAGMALRGTVARRVAPSETEVSLVLPPEAVLTGVVLGPDGKPVPAADVLVAPERPGDTREFLAPGSLLTGARADGAGRFVVVRLRPDVRYRVRAVAPGLAPTVVRDVEPGGATTLLRLTEGATVRGLVIATPGGRPVGGAIVRVGGAEGLSAEDGRFEIRGVPPGTWPLSVEAAGYLHTEDDELALVEGDVRVGLTVRVLGMARLKGRVLAPDTTPAAGAEIYLRYPPDPELAPRLPPDRIVHVATADAEGRFDAKGLFPAQGVDLVAVHPDHAPTTYLGFSLGVARTIDTVILLRSGGRLSGRVVREDGKGIPGMRVVVLDDRTDLSGIGSGEVPTSPSARETVSGPDGAFALSGVPGGRRALVAVGEGLLPAVLKGIDIADRSERRGLILLAGEGFVLSGRVLGPDGVGVVGARLTLEAVLGAERAAVSGDDGGFRMEGLPGGVYRLVVRAEGFAELVVEPVRLPSAELSLGLQAAAGLAGRVLIGGSSEPVRAARVRALRRGGASVLDPDRATYEPAGETRTGVGDGFFLIGDLDPGTYRVEAWTDEGEYGYVDGIVVGGPESGSPVTVRVEPGQTVTGRVVGGEDRFPVEAATVAVRGAGGVAGVLLATTLPDGTFELRGVPAGFHTLLVTARDRAPVLVPNVEVRPAVDTRVDEILLPRGVRIRGLVTGADREPRAGATIRLESVELSGVRTVLTDEAGRFLIEHVSAGSYVLTAEDALAGPGGRRYERLLTVRAGEDLFLAIGSGDGAALTGRVTAAGMPVAFAQIRLLRAEGGIGTERQVLGTRTDEDGNYLFPDVSPGDLVLLVQPPGGLGAEVRFPLRLAPGPVRIEDLILPDSGVEGSVTNLDTGEPLAGATVRLVRFAPGSGGTFLARLDRELGEVTSGPDGSFRFFGVPPGSYRLEAYLTGFGQTRMDSVRVLAGGATPVRVEMPPAGVLTGRVVDDDGRPISAARLRFLDGRGREATRAPWVEVDSAGAFRVDGLRTGTYTVEAVAPGYARVRTESVEVFPGSVPELRIALTPEGRLELTVYGPGGTRLAGARVTIRDFWGKPVRLPEPAVGLLVPFRDPALTREDGSLTVANLPPGSYEVSAEYPGLTGKPVRVRVLDGERSRGAVVLLPRAPKKE